MAWNLKEEATKLETQLENGCNKEKLSAECHLLGRFYEIVRTDDVKAASVYKSNCHQGRHGDSCYRFAQLCRNGPSVDHVTAFDYNRKGCQLGNPKSCLDAGLASLSDTLDGCVGEDVPMAMDFMERACRLGSGFGCYMLAGVYVNGVDGVVDRDLSAALKYDFEACQLNFPLACANLLNATSDPTIRLNNGVLWRAAHIKRLYGSQSAQEDVMTLDTKDKDHRLKLMNKLGSEYSHRCFRQNNPTDCHYLAHFVESVTKDLTKAKSIFRQNCDQYNYGPSCQKFAQLLRRDGTDPDLSFDYDRKGCNFGHPNSCLSAATAILPSLKGRHHRLDLPLAIKLLDRGCDLGCDSSCYLAGGLYLVGVPDVIDKNVSTTYKYDLKACQLGNRLACANLRGALPVESPADGDPRTNGFFIRLMQLKINNERVLKQMNNTIQ